jgi:predicted DCC family thiol-disulfide oxidoreductase YuxK
MERPLVVVWDDSCSFCSGWVRWFRRLDWRDALDLRALSGPLPEGVNRHAATEAMHVVLPDGSIRAGYAAVVAIARRLPLTMPLAPILWLLSWPGDRVYRRVAARRSCAIAQPADQTGLWLFVGLQLAIPATLLLYRLLTGDIAWYGWGWQMFS